MVSPVKHQNRPFLIWTARVNKAGTLILLFGNLAIIDISVLRPMTLRPWLSPGLPLSVRAKSPAVLFLIKLKKPAHTGCLSR